MTLSERLLDSFSPGDSVLIWSVTQRAWLPATFVGREGPLAKVRLEGSNFVQRVPANPYTFKDNRQERLF